MPIDLNHLLFAGGGLRSALVLAILSTGAAVGVYAYLNAHTKKPYFNHWKVGWVAYGLSLVIALVLTAMADNPMLRILQLACLGVSAVYLFLGSWAACEKSDPPPRLLSGVLVLVFVWSCFAGIYGGDQFWAPFSMNLLLALASIFTGQMYLHRNRRFRGATLLASAFFGWAGCLMMAPFLAGWSPMLAIGGYAASTVLTLFIALTMLVVMLEESREQAEKLRSSFWEGVATSRILKQEFALTEQKYRALFHSASDAVFIVDLENFEILEANEAATTFLNGRAGKAGGSFRTLCPGLADPGKSLLENKRQFDQLFRASHEVPMVRNDGQHVLCEGSANLVHYNQRPVVQLHIREVTERKRLEQQLRQSEKLSALGRLLAGVAHELNNPLAVVTGYTQLLARPVTGGANSRPEVQRIIHESDRAAKIVRKLLTFAQPHQPQMEPVHLNLLVAEVLETQAEAIRAANITLDQQLDPDLKKTVADPGQIEEVICNLVLNAIQVLESQDGPRTLTIVTEQEETVQRIIVTDSGPGIPADILGKIFDPFFTTKAPGKGTGLGLSICYSMIQEHHGRIWAENVPGGGARFFVELPYVPYEDVIAAPVPPPAPRLAPPPDAAQRRLLVVDDEPGIIEVLRSTLESSGYTVETAANGNEALKQLEAHNYDLIISDLCMPGMDGEALYNNVKAINPDLAKRIVFVTGDTVSEKSRRFLDSTGNHWLGKPFNLVEIEEMVTGLLCSAPVDFSKN